MLRHRPVAHQARRSDAALATTRFIDALKLAPYAAEARS
jgi:hypothetical protein